MIFRSFGQDGPKNAQLARQLGVQSQICGVFTAATVAAGLIFLAPLLEDLPKAWVAGFGLNWFGLGLVWWVGGLGLAGWVRLFVVPVLIACTTVSYAS